MLRTGSAVTALLVCLPSIVSAGSLAEQGRVAFAGHATLVLPQADADRFSGTSPGLRLVSAYWFTPHVAAIGSFDYVLVNEKRRVVGPDASIRFYAINIGARFALEPQSVSGRRTTSGTPTSVVSTSRKSLG